MNQEDFFERVQSILWPYADEQAASLLNRGGRLAHYTTANALVNILRGERFWLRNSNCLNDHSELVFGMTVLREFLAPNGSGPAFIQAVDRCAPGGSRLLEIPDTQASLSVLDQTFVSCLSAHDPDTDSSGRLSMWRAYGRGATGVALVLNPEKILGVENRRPWPGFVIPICYWEPTKVHQHLQSAVRNLGDAAGTFSDVTPEHFARAVTWTLYIIATSLKHPGFHEEQEWRIVHWPMLGTRPLEDPEATVWPREIITEIRGVPQRAYEVSIAAAGDCSPGPSMDELIHSVLIGPSNHFPTIADAIVSLLRQAGVSDAPSKVMASDIPLRY